MANCIRLRRVGGSGLPARFATCPPRFALLLDLRKTRNQPALLTTVSDFKIQNLLSSNGHGVSAAAKSRRRAKGPGDMSGSRYAVAVAGQGARHFANYQTKTDRK